MQILRNCYWLGKSLGWQNIPYRAWYEIQLRSGVLEERTHPKRYTRTAFESENDMPQSESLERWRKVRNRFFPAAKKDSLRRLVPTEVWSKQVEAVNEAALEGRYPYFFQWQGQLNWPPKFNWDPVNQVTWPSDRHWTQFCQSGPPRKDIKLVWEPARLALAFSFAREFKYSGNPIFAEYFWNLFEAFTAQNPPNYSAAWGCGQEVAWRTMALLFAAFTTLDAPATTSKRLADLELFCWQSGKRISATTHYARSQNNNHAISEAVGLWTIAIVFPWLRESLHWKKKAEGIIRYELNRQIFSDGSYVQHSTNYHRVLLDNLSWLISLARINSIKLDPLILEKQKAATEWLEQMIDQDTGRIPNIGCNDSALLLPLSCCDINDFRPALQTAATIAFDQPALGPGVWDEQALWLNQDSTEDKIRSVQKQTWNAKIGGYHILRNEHGKILIRACNFRSRPGQNDNLHVDVWCNGQNVLGDAGSYLYYDESPKTRNYFNSVIAHNTAQFSDQEQMQRGPGFQWYRWPKISTKQISHNEIECELRSRVTRGAIHRRTVKRDEFGFQIHDILNYEGQSTIRWRLNPELDWIRDDDQTWSVRCGEKKCVVQFDLEDPTIVVRESMGYLSDVYGKKRECVILEVTGQLDSLTTQFTLLGEDRTEIGKVKPKSR